MSLLSRKKRPIQKDEIIYSNWMDSMVTICAEITTESMVSSHILKLFVSSAFILLLRRVRVTIMHHRLAPAGRVR